VACRLQGLAPVLRLLGLIARAFEQGRDPASSTGVAIDDKDQAARNQTPPQGSEICMDLLMF
jgi:hypothetical protein